MNISRERERERGDRGGGGKREREKKKRERDRGRERNMITCYYQQLQWHHQVLYSQYTADAYFPLPQLQQLSRLLVPL